MKDKLTHSERVRLEALALAAQALGEPDDIVHRAEKYAQFVLHGLQVVENE